MPTLTARRALHRLAGTAAGLVLAAGSLQAQTVANPRIVQFTPSADHGATLPGGQPTVSHYDLEVYLAGAIAPFHTVNMGKPAPQSDGMIRFDFSAQVAAWPLPGGVYEARVSAVGPNGRGLSDVSNQFTFDQAAQPCSYAVSPSSKAFGSAGGSGSFTVSTGAGCSWSASTSVAWLLPGKTSGSGNATVPYTVAANSGTASRSGSVIVNGRTLTITQSGASGTGPGAGSGSCSYEVATPTAAFGPAGGQGVVSVMTGDGCAWSMSSGAAWLALATRESTGWARVPFTVAANTTTLQRAATITVSGKTVTITQAGLGTETTEPTCAYRLDPAGSVLPRAGGKGSFTVDAPAGCSWTVTSSASWLTPSVASGSGTATIAFTAQANPTKVSKTAAVSVGSQRHEVTVVGEGVPKPPKNLRISVVR